MKHRERFSWVTDKFAQNVTYDWPKPREYQELCSIANDKDNYSLSENAQSQTNIISKGFFQSEAQKALQNSQIEKAFEIAEQYIQISKRKFYRFLDIMTKKVIISKQLNRFDEAYVFSAKRKLKGLQRIDMGTTLCTLRLLFLT